MTILLIAYLILILFWFIGVAVATYHVFKYRLPGDATLKAFWIFLIFSGLTLLAVVFIVSGANWEGL
jgi:hypothetical protein